MRDSSPNSPIEFIRDGRGISLCRIGQKKGENEMPCIAVQYSVRSHLGICLKQQLELESVNCTRTMQNYKLLVVVDKVPSRHIFVILPVIQKCRPGSLYLYRTGKVFCYS